MTRRTGNRQSAYGQGPAMEVYTQGVIDTVSKLQGLSRNLGRNVLRSGLIQALKPAQKRIRAATPIRTGKLKRSVTISTGIPKYSANTNTKSHNLLLNTFKLSYARGPHTRSTLGTPSHANPFRVYGKISHRSRGRLSRYFPGEIARGRRFQNQGLAIVLGRVHRRLYFYDAAAGAETEVRHTLLEHIKANYRKRLSKGKIPRGVPDNFI